MNCACGSYIHGLVSVFVPMCVWMGRCGMGWFVGGWMGAQKNVPVHPQYQVYATCVAYR